MSKPELKVIEGGKLEAVEAPESQVFTCWKCGASCVIYPRAKPIAVQHALPVCSEWKNIEGKKDDLERFCIKGGVHVLVPQGEA